MRLYWITLSNKIYFYSQLIGLAILGVTTFSYMESEIQATFNGAEIIYEAHILMYVLICIGSVTVIVAILGCSGAYHESTWMIGTYCTCVAVIICVEVAMGVLGILYQQEVWYLRFVIILYNRLKRV